MQEPQKKPIPDELLPLVDKVALLDSLYVLRLESVPDGKLREIVESGRYTFIAIVKDQILSGLPDELVKQGWGDIQQTAVHDDMAHKHMGARMLLAVDNQKTAESGKTVLAALCRWEFGYVNFATPDGAIIPAALSHMTTVIPDTRDGGLGTIMKYWLFQVANEASGGNTEWVTWTYDPMQGRVGKVNLGHLGAYAGAAGGGFEENTYGQSTGGTQHEGNPTDRFHVVYHPASTWSKAHAQDQIVHLEAKHARQLPQAVEFAFEDPKNPNSAIPIEVHTKHTDKFIAVPIPLDWDKLLLEDKPSEFKLANQWRQVLRRVYNGYFEAGYTAIDLVSDKEMNRNYIILCRDFDPDNPPPQLLTTEFQAQLAEQAQAA